MTCKHEKLIPKGNPPDWDLMKWSEDPVLKVNMCIHCHLLYWERND